MLAGVYGLFFEFSNPGLVLPGVLGAVCLLLGLFALQMLPVNYAGLALVLLGMSFMVAETFLPSFGALGIGGVDCVRHRRGHADRHRHPGLRRAAVADRDIEPCFGDIHSSSRHCAQGAPPAGSDRPRALIGCIGEMLTDAQPEGWACVHSEQWRVKTALPIKRGQRMRVLARNDLVLTVSPIESE